MVTWRYMWLHVANVSGGQSYLSLEDNVFSLPVFQHAIELESAHNVITA